MRISELILGRHKLRQPIWYGISNRRLTPDMGLRELLAKLFLSRADIIQWREKDLDEPQNQQLVRLGVELAKKTRKLFLLNSDFSLGLRESTDGVHLTSSQEIRVVKKKLAEKEADSSWIIGKSVHSSEEALEAERQGATYLILGPVFDPISKESFIPPIGIDNLSVICKRIRIPIFAIGGITRDNFRSVIEAGAAGIAGISWVLSEINSNSTVEH